MIDRTNVYSIKAELNKFYENILTEIAGFDGAEPENVGEGIKETRYGGEEE